MGTIIKLSIAVAILFGALFTQASIAESPTIGGCDVYEKECLVKWAKHYAAIYGIDEAKYLKTIQGESNWYILAKGDSGKAFGIGQYWEATFLRHQKACGLDGNYTNPLDQLQTMACAFSKGYAREWTVWRLLQK